MVDLIHIQHPNGLINVKRRIWQNLPLSIKIRLLHNYRGKNSGGFHKLDTISQFVDQALNWSSTDEGSGFWLEVCKAVDWQRNPGTIKTKVPLPELTPDLKRLLNEYEATSFKSW